MRFKVDENLHEEVATALRAEGHDAETVYEEGLRGHSDRDRYSHPTWNLHGGDSSADSSP